MVASGDIIMFGWLDSIGHCEGRCCRGPSGMHKQLWQVDVAAAQTAANEKLLQISRIQVKLFLTRRAGGSRGIASGDKNLMLETGSLSGRGAWWAGRGGRGGGVLTETNGQAECWSQDAAATHQPLLKPWHREAQSQSQASIRPPE